MQTTTTNTTETQNKITVTPESLDLLVALVKDSGNWSNHPMLDLTDSEKGNFTDLKKKGLVSSHFDEGINWASFKFVVGQIVTDGVRSFSFADCQDYSTATQIS
jgi:hypothetical protein